MGSLASRRNALVFSLGWWLLRRRLRRRARAALAALPVPAASRATPLRRPLLLLGVLAGAGFATWRWCCRSRGAARGAGQAVPDRAGARSSGIA